MLTALLVGVALSIDPAGNQCTTAEIAAGLCSITNTGSTVEVGGTRGGSDGSSDHSGASDDDDATNAAPPKGPSVAPCDRVVDPLCRNVIVYTVEVQRQPTLSDLASFAPASVPLLDEPDGVGIVGMPMNFVVDARPHEQTGTLFDRPVTVRFAPLSVVFSYGDGATRSADDGGSTWTALGLAQFSATPTSHAYGARGTYTASATVRYGAAVNFGGGWVSVPGVLEIPTGAMSVQVFEVRTALVDKTCLESPHGPGC